MLIRKMQRDCSAQLVPDECQQNSYDQFTENLEHFNIRRHLMLRGRPQLRRVQQNLPVNKNNRFATM
jgi:hypothetical protein